jgi:surface polysaccharide O-acyltransferase-like enzyme
MSRASLALSNLRGIVIVIVLAFHSSLAYLVWAPDQGARFDQAPYNWQAFPIVDTHRWIGFDVFCAWQDVSLMSTMFFLSGLFVAPGLLRKGSWSFVADRIWRIGLPFVLVVLFLSPLALYPAYSVRTVGPSFVGFWQQWTSLPFWPNGPEWFLCVLLVLNLTAAGLYALAPGYIKQLGHLAAWACKRPIRFLAILVTISLVAYVPLALAYSPWSWSSVGPFSLQLSRPAIYLTYFFAGLAVGQVGLDRGLLTGDGLLARRWLMWLGAAVVSFGAWAGLTSLTIPDWASAHLTAQIAATVAYPFACATGCLFLLAVCLRFSRNRILVLDSLSSNAYAMYLVHYVFVVWLQYALLGRDLFPIAKVAIVLSCTLILSWASSAAFNRFVLGSYIVPAKRAILPVRD